MENQTSNARPVDASGSTSYTTSPDVTKPGALHLVDNTGNCHTWHSYCQTMTHRVPEKREPCCQGRLEYPYPLVEQEHELRYPPLSMTLRRPISGACLADPRQGEATRSADASVESVRTRHRRERAKGAIR